MDFLGVEREPEFSPGKVDADAAILRAVAEHLGDDGSDVVLAGGRDLAEIQPDRSTIVFAMCQSDPAIATLTEWQSRGVRVINRPEAILDSQRFRAIPLLEKTATAVPPTKILRTDPEAFEALGALADGPVWVKRGDVHATQADDVVRAVGRSEIARQLQRFRERGIDRVAVQRHVEGVVFKFYAVANGFFHCVVPDGLASPSDEALASMAALGARGAAALDLEVYGGDCVLDAHGVLHLIDLNDWPSYGPCRARAAAAIAAYIHAQKDRSCR